MLTLDMELAAVDTVEADVDALYQSVNQVEIALEDFASQPCEAFVCGINPGENGRVYAGINLMRERRTLVYAAGNLGTDRGKYGDALQAALDFLEPLGFQLQEVNLNYSAAMRQVILKGVTGIRLPGSGKPEWKQRLEEVVATQEAAKASTTKETVKKSLKPQVAPPPAPEEKPAPAVAAPPPRRREGGDDVTAMLRIDIARLEEKVAELEAEAAPRKSRMEKLERELREERQRTAAAAEERERTKREAEKSAATANRTIAALKKELDAARGELDSLKERLDTEHEGLQAEVKELQARNEELEQRGARTEKELSRRLAEAEADVAGLQTARAELEQRLQQQEEDHEQELVRLVALAAEAEVRGDEQLQAHRRETHQRLAAVRQVMARLWEDVGDEAMPAGEELLQQLAEGLTPLPATRRRQRPSLPSVAEEAVAAKVPVAPPVAASPGPEPEVVGHEEIELADLDVAETLAAADEAVTVETSEEVAEEPAAPSVISEEVEETPAVAVDEVAGDGTVSEAAGLERSRLAELFSPEGAAAAPEPPPSIEPVRDTEPFFGGAAEPPSTPPTWGRSPLPEAPPEMFAAFDLTGGGGQAATTFLLDEEQSGLTVPASGLLEIYRSANVQRIAPTGGAQVEGLAFVCAFREGEGERVVVVLEMKKGGDRFVYLPGDPSLTRESLVQSAIAFLEEIGFFMLAEPLADDPAERRGSLEECASFVDWGR